nr:hypothetical protein [Micromonospora sp. DSM 115978]
MERRLSLIMVLLATCLVGGCSATVDAPSRPIDGDAGSTGIAEPNRGRYGPDVIHLAGLRDIEFGESERKLTREGALVDPAAPCGARLTGVATASPVFDEDRLVLLWAEPPMQTPEGITIGTPVEQVRKTYPDATKLTAPPGTYRFDGLLAKEGDRAYLFLHDGRTVRKTVAGYADYARKLFEDGFGTC